MKKLCLSLLLIVINHQIHSQSKINVDAFKELELNSGINVSLIQDGQEFIRLSDNLTKEDIEIKVIDGKLKILSKEQSLGFNRLDSVHLIIHYKSLSHISVIGNEKVSFEGMHKGSGLEIKLFDNSNLSLNEVKLDNLQVYTYGDSFLLIENGYSEEAVYRCYSSSKINTIHMESDLSKVVSFGSNFIRVNASELLDITSYGDTKIDYIGDLRLKKGIIDGRLKVKKILKENL
ncbi:DUF2807 domain-containing protein [Salegentibacter sp. LM13S]|uniref:GIN domain-containing protein n=1 Tax=Salegentibacter lacus TaxID=2873599 RepID=UPI001CCB1DB8|nr:DUF2807 domain-containing protein [Salegentibacter lacus]MBZ9629724.1 DUF2807 domain-containing protein [Salegentibacter lacus]